MPIPTPSDAWQSAEQAAPLRDPALEFLREHPAQAFHARELADELLGLEWGARVEKRQRRSQHNNANPSRDRTRATTEAMFNFVGAQAIGAVLRDLVDRGTVEVRNVAMDEADMPGPIVDRSRERTTVAYYAYAGDSECRGHSGRAFRTESVPSEP